MRVHFVTQIPPKKYKEGYNRPFISVKQISLVHNHDKAGNKRYTQNNTGTRENPKCVNRCPGSVNSTCCRIKSITSH